MFTPTIHINIIAAIGKNNELGKDNKLIWYIPEDMQRFKQITDGHVVIMGRKTFESLPAESQPLPGRTNIVITNDKTFFHPDCYVANNLNDALTQARMLATINKDIVSDVFIIGGASLYEQCLPIADTLHITHICETCPSADTFFPKFNPKNYDTIAKSYMQCSYNNDIRYYFETIKRKQKEK